MLISLLATTTLVSLGCVKSEPTKTLKVLPEITASKLQETIAASKKPAVINLWATWCEPCKAEMPELKKFRDSEQGKAVSVIFISADTDSAAASNFLKELGLESAQNYRLAENPDEFGTAWAPSWSATLPTTFIADAQGQLKTFWVGETTLKQLTEKVKKALSVEANAPALQRHAK